MVDWQAWADNEWNGTCFQCGTKDPGTYSLFRNWGDTIALCPRCTRIRKDLINDGILYEPQPDGS